MHSTDDQPFAQNEHGHYVIEVSGRDLTGKEELFGLTGFIRDSAIPVLQSAEYDLKHYLKPLPYQVVLVRNTDMKTARFSERTTANYVAYGESFGYHRSRRAGLQPRLHEVLAGKMEMMGGYFCTCLHLPIMMGDQPTLLYSRQYPDPDGWMLTTDSGSPGHEWHDTGFIAFEISE